MAVESATMRTEQSEEDTMFRTIIAGTAVTGALTFGCSRHRRCVDSGSTGSTGNTRNKARRSRRRRRCAAGCPRSRPRSRRRRQGRRRSCRRRRTVRRTPRPRARPSGRRASRPGSPRSQNRETKVNARLAKAAGRLQRERDGHQHRELIRRLQWREERPPTGETRRWPPRNSGPIPARFARFVFSSPSQSGRSLRRSAASLESPTRSSGWLIPAAAFCAWST